MRQHLVRVVLGLAITCFFIGYAAHFYRIPFIAQLDRIIYDARLRLTMPRGVDRRIVILDIDEKSLQLVGRWPWPRNIMARLVNTLFDKYHVAVLAFDVVFAEPDHSSGIAALDALAHGALKDDPRFRKAYARMRPHLDNDAIFAAALKGRPVVLGYYLNSDANARRTGALPPPVLPKGAFAGRHVAFPVWHGYGGNLAPFVKNAAAAGHFNPLIDPDGVVRRVPLLAKFNGAYYGAFSLAVVRTLLGFPKVVPGFPKEGERGYGELEWLDVGPLRIPVDDSAAALVPYRGPEGSFPYVSIVDVLDGHVKPSQLDGRIALVGTTAPGLLDLRSTPVDSVYPGVEIHANLIAGMLDGTIKQEPGYVVGAEVLLLLVGGLTLSLLIPLLSPLRATLLSVLGVVLVTGLDVLLWDKANLVLPIAAALLMILTLYTVDMAYGYFVESRSKRQFTELFGQYVPPELVDRMARNPGKYSMEGREEVLSVLFSDVRGFTHISESLSAKDLSAYINDYLTAMSLVIRSDGGTLDKYIGDAIMAFWGAPVENAQHARHAVLTALQMQRRAEALSEEFQAKGWPAFRIGVGVNTGLMRVGDMGSKLRKAYTVMGDPVNLGSRLEGLTKQYHVGVLVGESTRDAVQGIVFREVDRVRVKGKDEAVAIFEPLGLEGAVDAGVLAELGRWHECLAHYRACEWDRAEAALRELRRGDADRGLYALYAERVARYRGEPPPPDWDGVTSFETK